MRRSISLRLSVWYASAATITLAVLFAVGYQLLESYLVHGLDQLIAAEFRQVRARLGPHYRQLSARDVNQRIQATSGYDSVLFYIDVRAPQDDAIFASKNLDGRWMPEVADRHGYSATLPGIGRLRIEEFALPPFVVLIGTSSQQIYEDLDGYVEICVGLLAAMFGVSTLIGFALSRVALRPVRLIRETALRIGSDNLRERIPVSGVRDEIAELARLLNQMFDRLESSFNAIRRFTAEASHELKTPLSLIRLQAEKLLMKGELSVECEESVQMQLEELARLSRIIEELLFLSRAEARVITLRLTVECPRAFLGAFAQDARVLAEHRGRCFELHCVGDGRVLFEPQRIRQVLLNLLVNALNASPAGGRVRMCSEISNGCWRVSLEDQGPGIAAADRERVFERFVRLDKRALDEQGSGLGLAICRSIVELHRGRIWCEPACAGGGLKVTFVIPADALSMPEPVSASGWAEAHGTPGAVGT